LLDTHVFLWWDREITRLSRPVRAVIEDQVNAVYLSAASVWEIAVKRARGKLTFGHAVILDVVAAFGFEMLPITGAHAEYAGGLPRHHDDPFDRLIIAQAHLDGMVLATSDGIMQRYGVPIIGSS
jgi:PIN domain nuclease of toxin-antitoxin system